MSPITTDIRNGELQAMVDQLKTQKDRRQDLIVPASAIRSENGLIRIDGEDLAVVLDPTDVMINTMHAGHRLDLPGKTLHEFHAGTTDLDVDLAYMEAFDAMVNARLVAAAAKGKSFMVRTFTPGPDEPHGIGRALLSNGFKVMDNFDTLVGALEAINEAGVNVEIQGCDLTETRMRVRLYSPQISYIAAEWLKGYRNPYGHTDVDPNAHSGFATGEEPIVFAGFEISNSETGGGALSICPRFVIQICRNGARITKDVIREVHSGTRLDHGVIDYADDTRQAAHDLTIKMTRDAVTTFLDPDYLEARITELEAESGTPVPAGQAPEVIKTVAKSQRFTDAEADNILGMFVGGGQLTCGGVMQAVTAASQTVPDPERAARMEEVAVDVMREAAALVAV